MNWMTKSVSVRNPFKGQALDQAGVLDIQIGAFLIKHLMRTVELVIRWTGLDHAVEEMHGQGQVTKWRGLDHVVVQMHGPGQMNRWRGLDHGVVEMHGQGQVMREDLSKEAEGDILAAESLIGRTLSLSLCPDTFTNTSHAYFSLQL